MSTFLSPSVVLTGVSFAWPDGATMLDDVTVAFGAGRTGLIGANGGGKSTLLRLIAGELAPGAGSIQTTGAVGHLPQQLTLRAGTTVADLLGVRARVEALRAIESGDVDPRHFDVVGDDWDVEARSRALMGAVGLGGIGLDRPVQTLSGGEATLAALAGLRLAGTPIVLLDEPTNNLDRDARRRLHDQITTWPGALIVVSHDVALLDLMDDTAELRHASLAVFGGPYHAYRQSLATEQEAAEQALRTAQQALKTEQRQRIEAQTKMARRQRYARADYESKRRPKIVMNNRRSQAQVAAGKLGGELDEKVEAARRAVDERAERVRRDETIRIDLDDPGVPAGRRLAELHSASSGGAAGGGDSADGFGGAVTVVVRGPERVALVGRNGIGKTRLLETLVHPVRSASLRVYGLPLTNRIGYLPQRLDHLDDEASVIDVVRRAAPLSPPGDVRAKLARFLFRGDRIHQPVGLLSGGERFRVALAGLLLATPPNQLLILDEPTNNLDLRSVDELADALDTYRGGMIVVSHDDAFLARLRIDTWVTLDESGLRRDGPASP